MGLCVACNAEVEDMEAHGAEMHPAEGGDAAPAAPAEAPAEGGDAPATE